MLKRKVSDGKAGALKTARACLPIGEREGSGLLRSHLLVVVMAIMMVMIVMIVMIVVTIVVIVMMMVLFHRSRVSAGSAEDRHRERQRQGQPECGEGGLLHDFVSSFCAGVPRFTGPNR
jgi:hypothetical protein